MKKRASVVISLILSASLVSLVGCGGPDGGQADAEPPKVVCVAAQTKTITDYDEFVGRTEAAESVDVQARVSGVLQTVEFEDGQVVQVGDLLATIEPDEYQAIHDQSLARIELAKSKLELARSELARSTKLVKSNAVSQEEFEEKVAATKEATAEVTVAEADAARSSLDLKYTKITAPISGRIDRAFVTQGNMLTGGLGAGTLLTRIVAGSPMYVNFNVDELTMLRYIRGKDERSGSSGEATEKPLREMKIPCQIQLQDEDEFAHDGVLDFLETEVDTSTGTIQLRGVFSNEDGLLQSGMFVRVRIPTGDPYEAVLVPEISIGTDQSYKFVFVVDDQGTAERRTVELGKQLGTMRVVRSGVNANETVVARGVQRVRPGMKVNVEMETVEPAESESESTESAEASE